VVNWVCCKCLSDPMLRSSGSVCCGLTPTSGYAPCSLPSRGTYGLGQIVSYAARSAGANLADLPISGASRGRPPDGFKPPRRDPAAPACRPRHLPSRSAHPAIRPRRPRRPAGRLPRQSAALVASLPLTPAVSPRQPPSPTRPPPRRRSAPSSHLAPLWPPPRTALAGLPRPGLPRGLGLSPIG
jgi:hypothetical protein